MRRRPRGLRRRRRSAPDAVTVAANAASSTWVAPAATVRASIRLQASAASAAWSAQTVAAIHRTIPASAAAATWELPVAITIGADVFVPADPAVAVWVVPAVRVANPRLSICDTLVVSLDS